jgi:hypothetical protein
MKKKSEINYTGIVRENDGTYVTLKCYPKKLG